MKWPNNARCAVAITIDVDGDLPFLALDPSYQDRLKSRSVGLYGPDHGAQRLLAVLERLGIKATWFIPGAITETHPELVREIAASGHDVGSHGNTHLDFDTLNLEDQIQEILGGRQKLADLLETPVRGFRTPAGTWGSTWTLPFPPGSHASPVTRLCAITGARNTRPQTIGVSCFCSGLMPKSSAPPAERDF